MGLKDVFEQFSNTGKAGHEGTNTIIEELVKTVQGLEARIAQLEGKKTAISK